MSISPSWAAVLPFGNRPALRHRACSVEMLSWGLQLRRGVATPGPLCSSVNTDSRTQCAQTSLSRQRPSVLLPLACKAAPMSSVPPRHVSPAEPSRSPGPGKTLAPVAALLCGGRTTLLRVGRAGLCCSRSSSVFVSVAFFNRNSCSRQQPLQPSAASVGRPRNELSLVLAAPGMGCSV